LATLVVPALCLIALAPRAPAQGPVVCLGDTSAAAVPQLPGPRLRFGINPAGEAGAVGAAVPAVPDDPPRTLAALNRLRPPRTPIALRLNRFFWSAGEEGVARFLALARHYTDAGYLVELQLRYHPTPAQVGDIPAWTDFVREVVRRFGRNRRVTAIQVTNEVNFLPIAPDASDAAFSGARDALIQGVIAAEAEANRDGYRQLKVGFNWAYWSSDPSQADFWNYLRDHGGPKFIRAVDWVGLDAYPGTIFPPVEPPRDERDGLVSAISALRCFMPLAGLGPAVPIHIEENGWPTGPGRSEAQQEQALRLMVGAANDFRGTYNVTDYRWFDLRDHRTSSANFQQHYGLLRDDYSEKPAFGAYRQLLNALAARRPRGKPRVRLRLRFRPSNTADGQRCADSKLRVAFAGADAAEVYSAGLAVGKHRVGFDDALPIRRAVPLKLLSRRHSRRLRARIVLADGRAARLGTPLLRC
jgi:hypothetical protein